MLCDTVQKNKEYSNNEGNNDIYIYQLASVLIMVLPEDCLLRLPCLSFDLMATTKACRFMAIRMAYLTLIAQAYWKVRSTRPLVRREYEEMMT